MTERSRNHIPYSPLTLLLAGFCAVLPILYWAALTDFHLLPRLALTGAVVATGLVLARKRWGLLLAGVPRPLLLVWLLYVGWGALSIATAHNAWFATYETLRLLVYTGLFLLLSSVFREGLRSVMLLFKVLTLGTLFQALLGLAQYFAGWFLWIPPGNDAPYGLMGAGNYFGEAMLLLCVVAAAVAALERGAWRWLGGATALLCVVAGLAARTNAVRIGFALVLLMAAFCVVAIWLDKRREKGLPWWGSGQLRLLLLVLLLAGGAIGGYALRKDKFATADVAQVRTSADSEVERFVLWRESLRLTAEHPVLGVGPGNWKFHILGKGVCSNFQGFATRFYMRAHNDFLQSAAERGWIGGLAYLAVLLLGLGYGWRLLEKPGNRHNKILLSAGMCGLAAWTVLSSFAFPMERPLLFLMFFIFLSSISNQVSSSSSTKILSKAFSLTLIPVGIFFCVMSIAMADSDCHSPKIMQAKVQQNWPLVMRETEAAKRWYASFNSATNTPFSWYIGTGLLMQGGNLAAFSHLQEAYNLHPWHPHVISNYAATLYGQGQQAESILIMENLLAVFPEFHNVRINLNELYLQSENKGKVNENLTYWENNAKPGNVLLYLQQVKERREGK